MASPHITINVPNRLNWRGGGMQVRPGTGKCPAANCGPAANWAGAVSMNEPIQRLPTLRLEHVTIAQAEGEAIAAPFARGPRESTWFRPADGGG